MSFGYRMSGLQAGCPGFKPDVRAARRISGHSYPESTYVLYYTTDVRGFFPGCPTLPDTPDVRAISRMSGLHRPKNAEVLSSAVITPDVRPSAGYPGLPDMPDVRA